MAEREQIFVRLQCACGATGTAEQSVYANPMNHNGEWGFRSEEVIGPFRGTAVGVPHGVV